MVVERRPLGTSVRTGGAPLAFAWALWALLGWPFGAARSLANDGVGISNPSFELGLDAGGLPRHWQGNAKRLALVRTDAASGSQAVKIAPGGNPSPSQ